ncbi:CHAT domain-containing protein [Streptomyces sp. NPDC102467]|uniref:CHAT domain-containing protein n=1 Tax=Streptomyces sp. NPDC102467 TaxID=3366179 RepID=UPI003828DAC8
MQQSSLAALRARLDRFVSTRDPTEVLGADADAEAARIVSESASDGGLLPDAALTLGWYHWLRCVARQEGAQQGDDSEDFAYCLAFLRPLHNVVPPDSLPGPALEALNAESTESARSAQALRGAIALLGAALEELREGGQEALDRAASLAEQVVGALAEPTGDPGDDENSVRMLHALGRRLVTVCTGDSRHPAQSHPRLLAAAAAAWDLGEAAAEGPDALQEGRLRLAFGFINSHLAARPSPHMPSAAVRAAAYLERLAAGSDPTDAHSLRFLEMLDTVLPPAIAQGQPELLRARARALRVLAEAPAVDAARRLAHLADLGLCLRMTYAATHDAAALDEAIDVLRDTVGGTRGEDPGGALRMASLANALKSRAHDAVNGEPGAEGEAAPDPRADVAEAEKWARRAQETAPDDITVLSCLGNVLRAKALVLRDMEAVRESARINEAAARALAPDAPEYPLLMENAALSYHDAADATGDLADADRAIALQRRALALTGPADPKRFERTGALAEALTLRGRLGDDLEAVAEGRDLLESLIAVLPAAHPEVRRARSHLIASYRMQYELTRDEAVLDMSLELARAHLADPALGEAERGEVLYFSASALATAFTRTRDPRLLDELMPVCRAAVQHCAPGSFLYANSALILGTSLVAHYEATRDGAALLEAMDVLEEVTTFPESWRTTPDAMARLAEARLLHTKQFTRFMALAREARAGGADLPAGLLAEPLEMYEHELDSVVELARGALALRTAGSQAHCVSLSYLAVVLLGRARELHSVGDAREAAELLREALRTGPPDDPDQALWRSNLVGALGAVHEYDETPSAQRDAVLAEAEAVAREAVARADTDGVARSAARLNLAHVLRRRADPAAVAEAITLDAEVHRSSDAPLPDRLRAAAAAGRAAAAAHDWAAAADHYEAAVDLLPRLVGHRLGLGDSELLLSEHQSLACEAAACALHLGDPLRALNVLERGRGILLGQVTQTRHDLSDLRRRDAGLADEFARLGAAMTAPRAGLDSGVRESVPGPERDTHRLTVRAWERVRDEIRRLPGFASFLRPQAGDLAALSAAGPVVVVNLATTRSDAIVVVAGEARVVPLPGVTLEPTLMRYLDFREATGLLHAVDRPALERWQAGQTVQEMLAWLWESVAEPVLRELNLRPDGTDPLPRLWWCPTGLMSFLPLHAAGRYGDGAPHGVADYVMSSYTTTLNSLTRKPRSAPRATADHSGAARLLVVATPDLPGHPPLPHTAADGRALAALFPRTTVLSGAAATKQAVLDGLRLHSWVHFACHTQSSFLGTSANALVLHDGPLSVPDVSAQLLDGEFAFLASCGSASGAERLADEAHHIASSFQLAGFTHVIATLWDVADGDATRSTQAVYAEAARGTPPYEAVHRATRDLRDRYPHSPWLWAPYLHMGP